MKVLVIEDNVDICTALVRWLQMSGLPVDYVHDGAGAPALIRRTRPTVLILDQSLPGMTGLEILRAVRTLPEVAHTVTAFHSAGHDARPDAENLGARWFTKTTLDMKAFASWVQTAHDTELLRRRAVKSP